jgi:hypothetical protein
MRQIPRIAVNMTDEGVTILKVTMKRCRFPPIPSNIRSLCDKTYWLEFA